MSLQHSSEALVDDARAFWINVTGFLSRAMSLESAKLDGYFTTNTQKAWTTYGGQISFVCQRQNGYLLSNIENLIIHGGPCPFTHKSFESQVQVDIEPWNIVAKSSRFLFKPPTLNLINLPIDVLFNMDMASSLSTAGLNMNDSIPSPEPTVTDPDTELAGTIDLRIAREWIENREQNPSHKFGSQEDIPEAKMLLIQCSTRKLVPTERQAKYTALSYVWGPQKSSNSDTEGGEKDSCTCSSCNAWLSGRNTELKEDVSRVVEHAMWVTLQLGLDFLWVDRHCIPQHNHDAKATQIGMMDLIYSRAYVTIVAAAASDPSLGLFESFSPFKSSKRGLKSPSEFRPMERISTSSRIGNATFIDEESLTETIIKKAQVEIKNSNWITRGWTYQEAVLSRRRLIFTKSYLYFESDFSYTAHGVESRHECHYWPSTPNYL
ncbi:hypothetical protein G7Y89_g10637 [Cudoniella acicularis]|uniref:Heterokaryon incompatibility domain-containing protein n=1 Tax=Cudoniella acicularis TaxID=354080 RepID=A0A8H4REP8_9HELO|nr:hypothetical protein G7Y89_g10637 [Cudoniella acicularis]